MNSEESKVRNSIPTLLSLLHLIFTIMEATCGGTLGKLALGLRIRKLDETSISMHQSQGTCYASLTNYAERSSSGPRHFASATVIVLPEPSVYRYKMGHSYIKGWRPLNSEKIIDSEI
jgi:hypothetical protein